MYINSLYNCYGHGVYKQVNISLTYILKIIEVHLLKISILEDNALLIADLQKHNIGL